MPVSPAQWDIVYLWTNGAHPAIQQKRQARNCNHAATAMQITCHGELAYSLQSVEWYMPWHQGKLYIVTEEGIRPPLGHLSPAMRRRITILNQDQILPSSARPAFNNMVVEAYLHRIPGVSNPFIYMNDDYLLGQAIAPRDFLHDGKIQLYHTACDVPPQVPPGTVNNNWYHMTVHTANLAQKHLHCVRPRFLAHMPYVIEKLAMNRVHQVFREEIAAMERRHSSRHARDVVVLLLHHAYLQKQAPHLCVRTTHPSYVFAPLAPDKHEQQLRRLMVRRPRFFTLNDRFGNDARVARALSIFFRAFYMTPTLQCWRRAAGAATFEPFACHAPLQHRKAWLAHLPHDVAAWIPFCRCCLHAYAHKRFTPGHVYLVQDAAWPAPAAKSAAPATTWFDRARAVLPENWEYAALAPEAGGAPAVTAAPLACGGASDDYAGYALRVETSAGMQQFLRGEPPAAPFARSSWVDARAARLLRSYRVTPCG